METPGSNHDSFRGSSPRRNSILSASNIIQAPISTLLEYSGLFRTRPSLPPSHEAETLVPDDSAAAGISSGEVAIRIIGNAEHDAAQTDNNNALIRDSAAGQSEALGSASSQVDPLAAPPPQGGASQPESAPGDAATRDSPYQRYDIQQAARWIEQILPFSLLLLVVFIRQHLQGFFVAIWIAAVMFKSNDILKKQTALKGERHISALIGISVAFSAHVVGVYWWFRKDDLLYPLIMLPPKSIPPFWHAIFIIVVNDTLVRQASMIFKCFLLMYYKNSRGRNYRKQGQLLTLVEYLMLLYRSLLPTPVWYRFFLNKDYGSLFSSLMTGLYLTFKLTSVVEKVQSFFTALKALSRKEVHYGSYATTEQVNAAGDLCAICQEKMHTPILLRCKHLFCEDCVSEWFERERTCPLCRALVKPADLKSFGDGSTSLFFQIF
ncbi:PREDICTED: RING finger and transmembrane domain-containing protein 2-like [Camelina sativa]|uniref:RING finger and transmembrane domain-containing protein 2 n=1 Tax=Camelina sativa TaxID=90675 RepID=A0ABM0Y7M2_CAMSA|nr:PREDICTED: RING finger and transmembrane domain-containing protein 2 [Camelina sativa]XP_010496814.1 PREDICTED: RING finger and transmembrane domain-containing protein 2-like [Camelina sativa]XP_019084617.1 PREDICTED: RING finger and transmembrane domain-containing protein 2 [Camelina sativa]XP_019098307.1 PREDICTED: RING finger and transmembrane domain-containing protein 2-like [Camelina sativa]